MGSSRSHHLLHHKLPSTDILEHFGSSEPKEIAREINKLGQRDLQAKFRAVYGTQTYSNNNCWLRRKLMEAAGLQIPKASSRGRPAVRQGRAPSSGSASQSEGPCMSRSGSMGSQQAPERTAISETNVIRRTKRPHKPKQYEDMLISAQLPGQLSDDEDCRPTKVAATESEMANRSDLQGQTHASELVWSRSTSQSFIAGHLISPSTSWTGGLAPATPEKAAFRAANPAILAARQGTAATKILGPQEVLGDYHSNLPAWADLPSNDRTSSQDLDEVSFQVQEALESGAEVAAPAAAATAASEVLIAPPTPDRMGAAIQPSASHLLHDIPNMPVMSGLLTRPMQKAPGMDFDFFATPPASVTSPELLPTMAPGFEKRGDFLLVDSTGMSDSAASEMSALDGLLEEFTSNKMAQEFDAWLKDMPGPELEPCDL